MPETSGYRLTPAASADIEAIVGFLNERNPIAAVRFLEALQASIEYVVGLPLAHPRLDTSNPALRDVRSRPLTGAFARYLLFYAARGDTVLVIRVLHSARDIGAILQ